MSFTPYQVDYSVQNTAKTMGFSKKRVTFKFGFADETAMASGLTGTDCRGSEHEVVFTWSLTTGKRNLIVDGMSVHFSESGQNGWTVDREWQTAFAIFDKSTHHKYKILFVSQPTSRETPLIKPFDLIISGLSYFQFNPLFQLGTKSMIIMPLEDSMIAHRANARTYYTGDTYDDAMDPEERRQLAAAKLASLRDLRESSTKRQSKDPAAATGTTTITTMKHQEDALISFEDDVPLPPSSTVGGDWTHRMTSSITLDPAFLDDRVPPAPYPLGAPPPPPPPTLFGTTQPQSYGNAYTAKDYYSMGGAEVGTSASTATTMPMANHPYSHPHQQHQHQQYHLASTYGTYNNPYAPASTSTAVVPVGNTNPFSYSVDATGRLAVEPPQPTQPPTLPSDNNINNPFSSTRSSSFGGRGGGFGFYNNSNNTNTNPYSTNPYGGGPTQTPTFSTTAPVGPTFPAPYGAPPPPQALFEEKAPTPFASQAHPYSPSDPFAITPVAQPPTFAPPPPPVFAPPSPAFAQSPFSYY